MAKWTFVAKYKTPDHIGQWVNTKRRFHSWLGCGPLLVFCGSKYVSLKAHKPEEVAIFFFSRVQKKHTPMWRQRRGAQSGSWSVSNVRYELLLNNVKQTSFFQRLNMQLQHTVLKKKNRKNLFFKKRNEWDIMTTNITLKDIIIFILCLYCLGWGGMSLLLFGFCSVHVCNAKIQ